ncbi:hypothetical protein ACF063_39310 [Streptomyces chartreusis]|uniref:hypothetical protein n=1 Tax=Streptomyces chartreusis TaxID=1969 RepID=UPI0037003A2E
MTNSSDDDAATLLPAALNIAAQWSALPPEHLREALAALDPQLAREHELRMRAQDAREKRMATEAEIAKAHAKAELEKIRADAAAVETRLKRAHTYRMAGLAAGLTISIAMLIASVLVAPHGPWLSCLFAGPGLLALVKIFVLLKSDPEDMRQTARAAQSALAAAVQPAPLSPPTPGSGQPPV